MKPKFIAAFLGPKDGHTTGITENGDIWDFTFPYHTRNEVSDTQQEPVWTLVCRGPVEPRN